MKMSRTVIDDGYNLPVEVLEEIDIRIARSKDEARNAVRLAHRNHKGDWLTKEVADYYRKASWIHRFLNHGQYVGMVRSLGEELQRKYGVTELEAINIMNGNHTDVYVEKYYRMRYMIPEPVDGEGICRRVISEHKLAR